jgi:serine/threonine protein phosphatase PrpC
MNPEAKAAIEHRITIYDDYFGGLDLYFFWLHRNGTYGMADTKKPHIQRLSLEPGDKVCPMTDGISDILSLNEMAKIASQNPNIKTLATALVQKATQLASEKLEIDAAIEKAEKEGREYNDRHSPLRVNKVDDATCIAVEIPQN